ncbi:MAG: hypothetical protein AAGF98_07330 [Cyanobacteria bacterium P01_H01_bin.153]
MSAICQWLEYERGEAALAVPPMHKVTLFLASSSELKGDREQFEIFIYRKCKAWFDLCDTVSFGGDS